jgi:hypothetical protein
VAVPWAIFAIRFCAAVPCVVWRRLWRITTPSASTALDGSEGFQSERFWLKLDGFSEVVQFAWAEIEGDPDPFRRLTAKLKRTARILMSWNDKKVGSVKLQLMTTPGGGARLDIAMESRLRTSIDSRPNLSTPI